jgi:hypothetical protein
VNADALVVGDHLGGLDRRLLRPHGVVLREKAEPGSLVVVKGLAEEGKQSRKEALPLYFEWHFPEPKFMKLFLV